MGWSYTDRPDNVRKYLTDMLESGGAQVLDLAIVNLNTAYVALKTASDIDVKVYAVVILLKFIRGNVYDFGYKIMDEFMGPSESKCPERILKLLSPLPEAQIGPVSQVAANCLDGQDTNLDRYAYARSWRARCYRTIEERKRAVRLKAGMRLKAKDSEGIELWDQERDEAYSAHSFTVIAIPRRGRTRTYLREDSRGLVYRTGSIGLSNLEEVKENG